MRTAGV